MKHELISQGCKIGGSGRFMCVRYRTWLRTTRSSSASSCSRGAENAGRLQPSMQDGRDRKRTDWYRLAL